MDKLIKIRTCMKNAGLDAIIIYDELNARYLSGFDFSDGLIFISKDNAHLLTDFRYAEAAEKSVNTNFSIFIMQGRAEYINEIIASEKIKTIGFEGSTLSFTAYNRLLIDFPGVEFVDIGNMINDLRAIKEPAEIENIKCSQEITDLAFSQLLKNIKTNMTEIEVAAELDYLMRKLGSEGNAFDTIAVSGDASSMPHGKPRNVKLKNGFLTIDFGSKYQGYCSDMTRTISVGKASDEMKKLYNTVLSAQQAALDFLRDGADAGEADLIARDIIDSVPEYCGAFGHSLGHSVGLYIHEAPSLSKRSFGKKLVMGNVVTVEPGIYISGKHGCRIEDMVLIKETGIYNFTKTPKELIEIY